MLPESVLIESIRSFTVWAHLLYFALATYTLIASDYAVWTGRWSNKCLISVGTWMKIYLFGLWITGGTLLLLDYGLDLTALVANSKASLKLIVVTMLTINGTLIHKVVFPIIEVEEKLSIKEARILATVSTMSTSHWFLAAFVGIFKPIAYIPLPYLLAGYVLFFVIGGITAYLVSPMIQTRINQKRARSKLINLGVLEPNNDNITLVGI